MDTNATRAEELLHKETSGHIIGAAFEVHRLLGYGFLEKVYQRAMQVELIKRGCRIELDSAIQVRFKGVVVGEYYADLLVNDSVIIEIKVAKSYNPEDEAQLLNELKATGIRVGILINFGRNRADFKRMVL